MSNIKPLGNRVLIKRSKAIQTKGGIYIPDSAQEKPKEGIVEETGPGKINEEGKRDTLFVKKGDRVLFSSYAGTEVKQPNEDEEYIIMSEDDILGVLSSN